VYTVCVCTRTVASRGVALGGVTMGANTEKTNLGAEELDFLLKQGHTVTLPNGMVLSPANANEAKPAANKPAAKKTTPANPKPNGFMKWREDTRVARDKVKEHKAAGRIAYGKSYNQLVAEKVVTKAGNLTAAHKAGKTNKTATAFTPEAVAYLKANAPELLV